MVKGKNFAPPPPDGSWYFWKGYNDRGRWSTTNAAMMSDSKGAKSPPAPPKDFLAREAKRYDFTHEFTNHDNRNAFQNSGEYFDRGLGRRSSRSAQTNLHSSSSDLLHHDLADPSRPPGAAGPMGQGVRLFPDFVSEYEKNFKGLMSEKPTTTTTSRRFARNLEEKSFVGRIKLSTSTIDWHQPGEPSNAPSTELLAQTQRFVPKSSPGWRYSFKN